MFYKIKGYDSNSENNSKNTYPDEESNAEDDVDYEQENDDEIDYDNECYLKKNKNKSKNKHKNALNKDVYNEFYMEDEGDNNDSSENEEHDYETKK